MRVKSSFVKKAMAVAVVMSIIFSVGIMQVFATENTAQASQKEVHGSIAPINEEYLEYIKNGKGLKGHIPSTLDLSYLGERYAESAVSLYSNLPEKYDLREEGLVGAVPDQGMYGTCWTFGVLGSAESALMKKQFTCVDFSKKHLAWFAAYGNEEKEYCGQSYRYYKETEAPYMMGGDNGKALAALAAWKGPIYSSKLPYDNFDVQPGESLRYDADFHVQDCVYMYTTTSLNMSPVPDAPDTELVKQFIMENGAYEISYLGDSEHYDEGNFATYHDEKAAADHSNMIVGWDDNFPKEKFKSGCQPEHDGAWLVRNSWSTSWGDSGYFWLSYEDKTIEMWGASFTIESKDNYANNYQYDTMGWSVSAAADDFIDVEDASKTAYISNIFTAKGSEQLEAVSFYTTDVGTEYEIYVYTGVTDGEPESGTLVCDGQEGAEDYCGYHTIELENPVALEANTKFSVVVKLKNPEYAYPIATEAVFLDDGDAEPTYLGNGGESYYSIDGEDWTDIVKLGKYASNRIEASEFSLYTTNVCLKAFTNPLPESGAAISNVVFSLFDGEVELGSELELSCANADEIYYTVTPLNGTASEAIKYNEYQGITITEPGTVTAWGVKGEKIGNEVSRTFTKQTSQLTELILKYCSDGSVIQIDLNNADSESVIENIDQNIQLKACGKDTITINDKEIPSNEWSDVISLAEGVTNNITIKTEGEGKTSSTYELKFYLSPLKYDYTKETVTFDDNVYTVTDESGDELTSGASVSKYVTVTGDDPKYLTVKINKTGETKELAVGQRPNLSCGIDYYNETTNVSFAANTYASFNADMSDAENISYRACELIPGKTVYIKRNATNYKFASNVYLITAPKRPEAPEAKIAEDGVGADNIVVSEIENGEYRIKPQNGSDDEWSEWQDENCFVELEPETEYTVEARVAATEESFASESASISVKTLAGVMVKIKYEAFNHTIWESEALCAEGETVFKPDVEEMEEWGYTVSSDDKVNGKTVTVENKDGVLTPDKEEVVFEVTADVNPSDYSYTVNYWDEYGKLIKTSSFNFAYTEEVELSEIKIPAGYVLDGLVNPSQRFIAQLVYDNDKKKWIIQGKEINLKVKLKENGSSDTTFRIVHTNDIHGYYTATGKGAIGFAKLKTLSDFVDAELILDAGDTYHGQAFATVEKGLGIAELMNEVGYDAMTVGNHDWSYGAERLKELEKAQGFPILAANVTDKEGNAYFDTPYLTKTVTADDGKTLKVGIVGVIDSSFYDHTASENVKDVSFKAQAAVASETAKTLKAEGGENCDIVIALAHIADCEGFVSELSDVDVVIAGHQHLLIDTSYTDKSGKNVYVVEAGYYFNNVGVLSLTYNDKTGSISKAEETIYTADDFAADSAVESKIKEIEVRQNETLSKVVGKSSSEYPYSWEEIRVSEQPIGRVITAAYLDCTGADVAFENAGGIRGGIPEGDITYKDIIGISPYGNTIVTKELSGKQIIDIIEHSLEISRQCDEVYSLQKDAAAKGEDPYKYDFPSNSGSVLQFGGITVKYDMTKSSGNRIVSAQIGGKAVDLDKKYVVATNNYAAESAEYPGIADAPLLKQYGTCEQALLNYVAKGTLYNKNKGGSGGSQSSDIDDGGKSETVTNPDGSTTKIETKTETKADGTKVETTTSQTTKTDGTKTEVKSEVTTAKDGTTTKTETAKTTDASGSTGTTTTVTDATGATTVKADATVSAKAVETAQKENSVVTVPVEVKATTDVKTAPTVEIKIEVKSSGSADAANTVRLEVPVTNVDSGTVAVIVKADGTEEIIKTTVPTENGVTISVDGDVTIKIVDNSKAFADTTSHWSKDEVNFVASRELFNGVGGGNFGVSEPMTRGMVNTVLARLAGEDTNGGEHWYDKGNEWAVKNGVSDGTNPTDSVTREQLATMLYRYAGSPEVSGDMNFADSGAISEYAQKALLWATQNGIMNGMGDGTIAPAADAERAQVAAMMARFLKTL